MYACYLVYIRISNIYHINLLMHEFSNIPETFADVVQDFFVTRQRCFVTSFISSLSLTCNINFNLNCSCKWQRWPIGVHGQKQNNRWRNNHNYIRVAEASSNNSDIFNITMWQASFKCQWAQRTRCGTTTCQESVWMQLCASGLSYSITSNKSAL